MDPRQKRLLQEQQRTKLESQLKQDLNEVRNKNKVTLGMDKFIPSSEDRAAKLAAETVGLVHLEQFQRIKEGSLSSPRDEEPSAEELEKRKKRIKEQSSKVSFSFDDEEEEDDDDAMKRVRIGPDPSTLAAKQSALQDMKDFEQKQEQEKAETLRLEAETRKKQPIKISCCFFDGTERRFMVEAKKGDTVETILVNCQTAFPPLKGSAISSLLFVKENAIIPHHMTVIDLLDSTKLFQFILDENKIEVDYSKNCKIVTRSWFERNKSTCNWKSL